MAYLLLVPVAYYGTSKIANKIFDMTSDLMLHSEELRDNSAALLQAAKTVLYKHRNMGEKHPAFKNKTLVEEGVLSLEYETQTVKQVWFVRNYHDQNKKLERLQGELERRLRLFLMVVKAIDT